MSEAALVFVCGAVGSGNTLMFDCLTQDENTYGVNEDALGATLERLVQSEKEFGRCPHSVDAFLRFLEALRQDRRTLVLKTPSNLRRRELIKRYLPGSYFVMMVREPHAAIVSGLSRHQNPTVEQVARTWLSDYEQYAEADDRSMIVTFESLVASPRETLQKIAETVMPLSQRVFRYAEAVASPQRAQPGWWQSKVDARTREEIEHWVGELRLREYYEQLSAAAGLPLRVPILGRTKRVGPIGRGWNKLREWAVKSLFKLKRHLGRVSGR